MSSSAWRLASLAIVVSDILCRTTICVGGCGRYGKTRWMIILSRCVPMLGHLGMLAVCVEGGSSLGGLVFGFNPKH
jgi:hypothetical protein